MNARQLLIKAQTADAIANDAATIVERRRWEKIADEYRRLAKEVSAGRDGNILSDPSGLER